MFLKINQKEMKIKTTLLRQLANHLLNGQLGHEVFDLKTINKEAGSICGTSGCAMGELPILFPNEWQFEEGPEIQLKHGSTYIDEWTDVEKFFGISESMATHLFSPSEIGSIALYQNTKRYGGKPLDGNSTKEEVAAQIIAFCELAERGYFD